MGEYADVKRKNIKQLLHWLETQKGITIKAGGKHQIIIKYTVWERPFPVPFRHSTVSSVIVKAFMKKLVDSGVCTKEEFDEKIS